MAEQIQIRVTPLEGQLGRTVDFQIEIDPYRVSESGIPDLAARFGAALDALDIVEHVRVYEVKGYSWEEVSYETPESEPEDPEEGDPVPSESEEEDEPTPPDDPPVSNS